MYDTQAINISLDLHNYNNQTIETDAVLKYSGKNFLGENHSYVWPYKFKINSNNYPLYVPNIANEFTPHKTDNSTEVIDNNSEGYYITDWAITVKLKQVGAKQRQQDGSNQALNNH